MGERLKVSVRGLHAYISGLTDERYAEAPIFDGLPTRREALRYLRGLAVEGKAWVD